MINKENKIKALKCLGYDTISEILYNLPDDCKWDLWKDFNASLGIMNFGIFVYDENMYGLTDFACHGGVLTGSKHHFTILKQTIPVKFHGWYQDNIFIILGCIPHKLWLQSGVKEYFKRRPV